MGEEAPPTARKIVQGYVSSLRKVLGDGLLVSRGHGYLLQVDPDQTDVDRFDSLAAEGHRALAEGDPRGAAELLRAALGLWRGPPLAEFAYESFAQSEIARLEELRLAALEDLLEAELALGGHARLVGELEALVHEHPLRERFSGQLMLALYRSGRQAGALETYRRARARLVQELGLEPGRELQELEQAILAQDPGEPYDMAWLGWLPDYLDPGAMLDVLLEQGSVLPTFVDSTWRARLAAASRLTGAERYLNYARLDADLARNAAPLVAVGNLSGIDFYSARIGCQVFGPAYGPDLAALCISPGAHNSGAKDAP